jgi:hypothetical protein
MKLYASIVAFLMLALGPDSLMAQYHTDRGAVFGGLTGALAGAGIGEHNGEAGAGALIGGAVGLITGAAIGNSMDQEEAARARAFQQHRAWQLSRAASISDVVTMSHNGLADDVIINHITQNGVQRRLEVADVISLHQQGVSEAVISAMQWAPVGGPLPPPSYRPPVIVQEHHYVRPPVHCWHGYPTYSPYYHRHHHPGVHWSIAVGR